MGSWLESTLVLGGVTLGYKKNSTVQNAEGSCPGESFYDLFYAVGHIRFHYLVIFREDPYGDEGHQKAWHLLVLISDSF